jgi:hypothetical protein
MDNRDKWCFSKDGRGYTVRFFDCENSHDLRDLVLIIESPEVQRWMDDVDGMNFVHYRRWMDKKGDGNEFLFAVADTRSENMDENRVHGFIFIYPSKIQDGSLEISFAKRPGAPSGLISPAIEVVCRYLYDYLSEKKPWMMPGLSILADIERANVPSIKVAERAGFKLIGGSERSKNSLWVRRVEMVKTETEEEVAEKLGRVRQLNNSYCGPAALSIILQHYGIEEDQEKIVAAASTREFVIQHGMSIEKLGLAVRNLYPEKRLWVKRDSSLSDVERMVREFNYPVGVNWQGIFETNDYEEDPEIPSDPPEEDDPNHICKGDAGHYSVVVDVDRANDNVRITDPYGNFSGEDRFVQVQDFLNRWWDDRMDVLSDGTRKYVFENRLMYVVVPVNVRLPEELGMTEL